MLVTLAGIVMLVSAVQPLNASFPMVSTLFGILMLSKAWQPLNALSPMLVSSLPSSKITLTMSLQQ